MRARHDPAWLQAQYDNRARVPGFAGHLERWASASRLVREQAPCTLDLPYGDGPGATLDVFPPSRPVAGGAPVLVVIHGGYWRALDKSDFSYVAPAFTEAGALVLVPNYALAPAVDIELIVLQMTQAVAWAWRNAAAHGGNPARIAVAGHSAGGHLAAMLLSCRWKQVGDDLPAQPLAGALSISGVYDLEPLRHTPFLQADLRLTPASVARLSPAFFPRPKGGPLYAVVGLEESDEFLRQNQLIRDVWGPTTVPVCETVARTNHFSVVEGLANPKARVHHLALRLLGLA